MSAHLQGNCGRAARQCMAVSPGEVVGRNEVLGEDVDKEESEKKRLNKRSE